MKEKVERDIAYHKYVRNKVIKRKKRISKVLYGLDWYRHDRQYSKGKYIVDADYVSFVRNMVYRQLIV